MELIFKKLHLIRKLKFRISNPLAIIFFHSTRYPFLGSFTIFKSTSLENLKTVSLLNPFNIKQVLKECTCLLLWRIRFVYVVAKTTKTAAEKRSGWISARFISFITHQLLLYLLISHKIFSWILLWNEYHQCLNTSITAISSLVSVSPELDLSAHVSYGYLFCFSTNHNRSYLTRDHRITSPAYTILSGWL